LIELGQSIDSILADQILLSDDGCSKLILLDMENKNLIDGSLSTKVTIQGNIIKDDLYNRNWLFVYESFTKNWLTVNTGVHPVLNDAFFKKLHNENITFYDSSKNIDTFNIDDLKVGDISSFQIDSQELLSLLGNMKTKISDADDFDGIKDTYQDLLSIFEQFIEDTNDEFSEHIKKLIKKKDEY